MYRDICGDQEQGRPAGVGEGALQTRQVRQQEPRAVQQPRHRPRHRVRGGGRDRRHRDRHPGHQDPRVGDPGHHTSLNHTHHSVIIINSNNRN